ncbi:MAG: PTS glucose transporter subunit IIA [Clostridiales bacterium]|jgi:PTS system D-glucosamine-specific IIC component|nr:PTS glucose transporter subunit IIA [Clostridiales bacterium]
MSKKGPGGVFSYIKKIGKSLVNEKETEGAEAAEITPVNEIIYSPLSGKLIPLEEVPDKVFSMKIMGDGFAVDPSDGEVVSPVNGKIVTVFKTSHAIGIISDNGVEVLVHFGIDTVNLDGKGLSSLVKAGDVVKVGQPILKADIDLIKNEVPSLITPVVFTNLVDNKLEVFKQGQVEKGEKVAEVN